MVNIAVAIFLSIMMTLVLMDVIINSLNPSPKMKDRNEERSFSNNIMKTRNMFEFQKR